MALSSTHPVTPNAARRPSMGREQISAGAAVAHRNRAVVHVVVTRGPGLVTHARAMARAAGIDVSVDLMPSTVRVRFDGSATA